jgi:DNA primase large subunit
MRINLTLIISLVFRVGLIALGCTFLQISNERSKLNNEFEIRTAQIADEFIARKSKPSEEEIREKAMEIYIQRIERGEYGTPEDDWLEAEGLLNGSKDE